MCVPVHVYNQRICECSRPIIMNAHLSHGCTELGQKKQPSAPLPFLVNQCFLEMFSLLIIRYLVHYSCLLIEKSIAVTSSTPTTSSSLPSSPSSSLPLCCCWSHDIVSLSESGCAVPSQICCCSETKIYYIFSLFMSFVFVSAWCLISAAGNSAALK